MFKRGDVVRPKSSPYLFTVMNVDSNGTNMLITSADVHDQTSWYVPTADFIAVEPQNKLLTQLPSITEISSAKEQLKVLRKHFMELGTQLIKLTKQLEKL